MNRFLVACNLDESPAVFDHLPGAPPRTLLAFSASRSDADLLAESKALSRAGYRNCLLGASKDDLQRWTEEGYHILIDPPLIETARIVSVSHDLAPTVLLA